MQDIFSGDKTVLFQGDSVTDCGRSRNDDADMGAGYPAKIAEAWGGLFPKAPVRFINRGVSGNRTGDLLERYENDFAALKPDLISILIGINDTWRRYDRSEPTSTEQFEKNYRLLLEKLRRDLPGAAIVIIEPFLLRTEPEKPWREDLDPKIQAVRALAMEYADVFIPMDSIFVCHAVAGGIKEADMAADGVHPTPLGHRIIATEWIKALEGSRLQN